MDIDTYRRLALRTAPATPNRLVDIDHAALGIGGESGEILDHVKKVLHNGRELDENHLIAEVGDIMWYLNLLVFSLNTTWSRVLRTNIAKLEARYPDLKFDVDKALNRNLGAEKDAMERAAQ